MPVQISRTSKPLLILLMSSVVTFIIKPCLWKIDRGFQSLLLMAYTIYLSLHKERVQALLNAHKGILSSALISTRQSKAIVDWTVGKHSHKPLVGGTLLYYNLATVHVIRNFVIALIPFDSTEDFNLYSLIPFPMLLNKATVIWIDVQQNFMLK